MKGKRKGALLAVMALAVGQAGVVQGAAPESITLSDSYVKADHDEVSQLKDTKQVIVITRKDMEGKAYINGESVNTIKFEQPIETRYIKMQGVDGTFQLREFEAYETVNKDHLKETLKAADDKLKEYGIQYGDEKYKEFFAAYMEAESAYENAYALNHNVSDDSDSKS